MNQSNNSDNHPRERSIPITTTQGDMNTTHFPLSSSPSSYSHFSRHQPSSEASHPFHSGPRSHLFDQLNSFRMNRQQPEKIFGDRSPFARSEFFSNHPHHQDADPEDEGDYPESHQPRVYNIPIQVETPEGMKPLVRPSNSQSPRPDFHQRNSYHASPTRGGGPTHSNSSSPIPERVVENNRSHGPSPTPPPKPKFATNKYQPEAHGQPPSSQHRSFANPQSSFHGSKSHDPYHQPTYDSSYQNVPSAGQRSEAGRDSPHSDSQSSGGSHVINIPINVAKSQSSESTNQPPPQSKPTSNQSKTAEPVKPASNDSLETIKRIEEDASRLEAEVTKFHGTSQDKQYRYLDEMLTRCMLKLDNIETNGRDDVRSARKSALAHVDRVIAILESRVNQSQSGEQSEAVNDPSAQPSANMACANESDPEQIDDSATPINAELTDRTAASNENADQMEVESNPDLVRPNNESEPEIEDAAIDDEDPGDEDEAIEEDPSGADGSSKDFHNCSNIQPSNENICRAPEEVFSDEMDQEKPQEKSSQINGPEIAVEITSIRKDQDLHQTKAAHSIEPKIELPPDDQDEDDLDANNNKDADMDTDSDCDKPVKVTIEIESVDSDTSAELDVQPLVELPDEGPERAEKVCC